MCRIISMWFCLIELLGKIFKKVSLVLLDTKSNSSACICQIKIVNLTCGGGFPFDMQEIVTSSFALT